MIAKLKKYLRRQEFNPGFMGLFVNPFYFARRGLRRSVTTLAPYLRGRILDVGCGSKPYKDLFIFTEYIGIDIENPGHDHTNEDIDLFYDGKVFPLADNSFDAVITNQVFEHVFNPQEFLSEIHRVLKPGGNLLLTVPFVWDEHEQPYDYARYSSFGIRHVLENNGFKIISMIKSVNDFRVIFQLIILFLYKKMITKNHWINKLIILFLISPINILGLAVSLVLPSNSDLYLDNIVLAQKKS